MKLAARIAALVGLAIALWLIARNQPVAAWGLLRTAGWGLVAAALIHGLPMLANAKDWQIVILGPKRPGLGAMLRLIWLRESIDGLLPVARVGGELVAFRLLRRAGVNASAVVGSLMVDTQLTLISQLLFMLLGVGYLALQANSAALQLAGKLAWAAAAATPILVAFALIQHVKPLERAARLLNQMVGGKLKEAVGESSEIDLQVKKIWRHWGIVLQYVFLWQGLQCLGVGLELWAALRFMHASLSLAGAFALEALLQALTSVAFFVPGNIGIQEGGFLLIGHALGLDTPTCVALAGARRIRDLLFYVPGVVYWQFAEK
ncbi:MAG TPA: lysylphosphatidylglycerol synthase domain-containing protein [Opitutaceae bacterium]|jgi:putative membrane protein